MTGRRPFTDLTKGFSPGRRRRVAEKVETIKTEMALYELRQARERSQEDLARVLHVGQPAVAKLERRADIYVSNLRRYIEALGGSLEIIARFPDATVIISNFGEIGSSESERSVMSNSA
ncbi:MAG TPA: XRE family transcriptional regulator [Beijerinckiaceae bacterium]|nr:XRE family transcriptional regulator [Beijerinckiaceae bacterium]